MATWIKWKGKEGIKTLSADWTPDNYICFREPIIISEKNNEDAIIISNNWLP